MTRQEVLHEAAWCLQMMLVQGFTWTEIECMTGIPYLTLKNIRAEKKNLSVDVISRMLDSSGKTLIVVDKEDKHG